MSDGLADLAIVIPWAGTHANRLLRRPASGRPGQAVDVETWVADNASTDGTVEAVAHAFPQVHLIANTANLGFAAANNQAASQTDSRYLLPLNPDTVFRWTCCGAWWPTPMSTRAWARGRSCATWMAAAALLCPP